MLNCFYQSYRPVPYPQTVVRGDVRVEGLRFEVIAAGIPKTSSVARSNSLRSSTPPQLRKNFRIPPSVPEEDPRHSQISGTGYPPHAFSHAASNFMAGQPNNHHHHSNSNAGMFPHHAGSRQVDPHSPVPSNNAIENVS